MHKNSQMGLGSSFVKFNHWFLADKPIKKAGVRPYNTTITRYHKCTCPPLSTIKHYLWTALFFSICLFCRFWEKPQSPMIYWIDHWSSSSKWRKIIPYKLHMFNGNVAFPTSEMHSFAARSGLLKALQKLRRSWNVWGISEEFLEKFCRNSGEFVEILENFCRMSGNFTGGKWI